MLWRLNADGSNDTSFGSAGIARFPGDGPARGLLVQPDGRAVAVGGEADRIWARRVLPDGMADASFGQAGTESSVLGTATSGRAISLAPAGAIVVAGSSHGRVGLVRFRADGVLDPAFGTGGSVVDDLGVALEVSGAEGAGYSPGTLDGSSTSRLSWGNNGHGQLGLSRPVSHSGLSPNVQFSQPTVASLAAGGMHTLIAEAGGAVRAWGWNQFGQLGDGTTTDTDTPVLVPRLTGVTAVAAGLYHSLALRSDGTVWAWGWNGAGLLGDGTASDRRSPVRVSGLTDVVAISAGALHGLAVRSDGTVWAWGWNAYGQLGDGTTADRHSPTRVPGMVGAATAAAGAGHCLVANRNGTVSAFGYNAYGQLAGILHSVSS